MEKRELEKNLEKIAENVKVTDLEEETKLSRLFYLQLYSSVLNAEKQNTKNKRAYEERKKLYFEACEILVESNDRDNNDKFLKQLQVFNLKMRVIASSEVKESWKKMADKGKADMGEIKDLTDKMANCLELEIQPIRIGY